MAIQEVPKHEPLPGLHAVPGNPRLRRANERPLIHARSEDGLFTWTYTGTLTPTYFHPEILVAGLDPFLANALLTHVVQSIAKGALYTDGSSIESTLHGLTCVFRRMLPAAAGVLMPALQDRPALQLVYPDMRDCLPWEPGHNPSWRDVQPLFLDGEMLGELELSFLEAAEQRSLLAEGHHREPRGSVFADAEDEETNDAGTELPPSGPARSGPNEGGE